MARIKNSMRTGPVEYPANPISQLYTEKILAAEAIGETISATLLRYEYMLKMLRVGAIVNESAKQRAFLTLMNLGNQICQGDPAE